MKSLLFFEFFDFFVEFGFGLYRVFEEVFDFGMCDEVEDWIEDDDV